MKTINLLSQRDIENIIDKSRFKEANFIYKEMDKLRERIIFITDQITILDKKMEMYIK